MIDGKSFSFSMETLQLSSFIKIFFYLIGMGVGEGESVLNVTLNTLYFCY